MHPDCTVPSYNIVHRRHSLKKNIHIIYVYYAPAIQGAKRRDYDRAKRDTSPLDEREARVPANNYISREREARGESFSARVDAP